MPARAMLGDQRQNGRQVPPRCAVRPLHCHHSRTTELFYLSGAHRSGPRLSWLWLKAHPRCAITPVLLKSKLRLIFLRHAESYSLFSSFLHYSAWLTFEVLCPRLPLPYSRVRPSLAPVSKASSTSTDYR